MGHYFNDYVEEEAEKVDDGPALQVLTNLPETSEISFLGLNLTGAEESYGFVLAINCEGWPLCAKEWITRQRVWPTQDVIEKIAKENFHIVKLPPKAISDYPFPMQNYYSSKTSVSCSIRFIVLSNLLWIIIKMNGVQTSRRFFVLTTWKLLSCGTVKRQERQIGVKIPLFLTYWHS